MVVFMEPKMTPQKDLIRMVPFTEKVGIVSCTGQKLFGQHHPRHGLMLLEPRFVKT